MSYIGAQPTTAAFVTDQFSANGSGTVFTLSVAPANTNSILVAVSGVLQDPSTYSVSGTTLTFSAAPPAGTGNISVRFLGIPASGVVNTAYRTQTEFTATAGQTTFSVPSYTVGYIDVYRNGARLNSADYTATSGTTVVLASGASSGDSVTTESFYVSSVLNAIPAVANAVTTSYINDASVTSAKFANLTTLPTSGGNITLPAVTGTAMVSGNMPSFRVYLSANQTVSNVTNTKITLDTEVFDTANCFNTSTNRFTPNVAGYYQFNVTLGATGSSSLSYNYIQIYKNGTADSIAIYGPYSNAGSYGVLSTLIYMNGTTDYIELYVQISGVGTLLVSGGAGSISTYMSGYLARAA